MFSINMENSFASALVRQTVAQHPKHREVKGLTRDPSSDQRYTLSYPFSHTASLCTVLSSLTDELARLSALSK